MFLGLYSISGHKPIFSSAEEPVVQDRRPACPATAYAKGGTGETHCPAKFMVSMRGTEKNSDAKIILILSAHMSIGQEIETLIRARYPLL